MLGCTPQIAGGAPRGACIAWRAARTWRAGCAAISAHLSSLRPALPRRQHEELPYTSVGSHRLSLKQRGGKRQQLAALAAALGCVALRVHARGSDGELRERAKSLEDRLTPVGADALLRNAVFDHVFVDLARDQRRVMARGPVQPTHAAVEPVIPPVRMPCR